MTPVDAFLTVVLIVTIPAAWLSTFALTFLAWLRPRIPVLTERAVIAFLIACFLSSAGAIRLNTTTGFALFPVDIARTLFLVSAIGIGLVPLAWLVLWLSGRLGGGPGK